MAVGAGVTPLITKLTPDTAVVGFDVNLKKAKVAQRNKGEGTELPDPCEIEIYRRAYIQKICRSVDMQ
jgi:hypothetical protein